MTDDQTTYDYTPRKAPGVSVMVHVNPTSKISGDAKEHGFSLNVSGDQYGSVTIFFPDFATVEAMRDALNVRLDEAAS